MMRWRVARPLLVRRCVLLAVSLLILDLQALFLSVHAGPMTTRELHGRTALITGSTDGIGVAIASTLAEAGAEVVVTGRNVQRGTAVASAIAARGGAARFVAGDIGAGAGAVRALAEEATAVLGGHIDILVNNAARLITPSASADVSED